MSMLPALTTKPPKRRQTCDPCRKAKIKCDKRVPICGRCLATGDLCGYGISRQGAWWRQKGRKPSMSQRQSSALEIAGAEAMRDVSPVGLSLSYSEEPSLVASNSSRSSSNRIGSEQNYDLDAGYNDLQGNLSLEDFSMPTQTPPNSAGITDGGYPVTAFNFPLTCQEDENWSFGWTGHDAGLGDLCASGQSEDMLKRRPEVLSATIEEKAPHRRDVDRNTVSCPCFAMVLKAFQALEESFPEVKHSRQESSAAAEISIILQNNERTVKCCSAILRCTICSEDHSKSPLVLLFTLIKQEVAYMEAWIYPQSTNDSSPELSTIITSDRHVKIEVAQVGTRRLRDILVELRKACQCLKCDFTRLAHTFLIESLMVQLRHASERLVHEASLMGSGYGRVQDDAGGHDIGDGQYHF